MQSARGASAFTNLDHLPSRPVGEASLILSTQEETPQRTWRELIDDLLGIRHLEDDWDGQGAEAPNPALVDGAIKLSLALQQRGVAPATRAIAGLGGTVYLEWQTPLTYCEIEVLSPLEAECRFLRTGAKSAEVSRVHLRT
jgi:hypothetical protein